LKLADNPEKRHNNCHSENQCGTTDCGDKFGCFCSGTSSR